MPFHRETISRVVKCGPFSYASYLSAVCDSSEQLKFRLLWMSIYSTMYLAWYLWEKFLRKMTKTSTSLKASKGAECDKNLICFLWSDLSDQVVIIWVQFNSPLPQHNVKVKLSFVRDNCEVNIASFGTKVIVFQAVYRLLSWEWINSS